MKLKHLFILLSLLWMNAKAQKPGKPARQSTNRTTAGGKENPIAEIEKVMVMQERA